MLEGGQRKEDGLDTYYEYNEKKGEYEEIQSKRREVFYNEVLAQDEIDSLFSPKAFCDAKRYEKGKSGKCVKVNRDAELNKKRGLSEDNITDNLIIKGNNLLALHLTIPQKKWHHSKYEPKGKLLGQCLHGAFFRNFESRERLR